MIRQKAKESLVARGKPAVPSLSRALRTSSLNQVRWEAATALGEIDDVRSIPSLVKALKDNEFDVVWLAAEALSKFKKRAWPALLRALMKENAESVEFQRGVHHVLANQEEDGFNDLLATLMEDLEPGGVRVSATAAANEILERMKAEAKTSRRS